MTRGTRQSTATDPAASCEVVTIVRDKGICALKVAYSAARFCHIWLSAADKLLDAGFDNEVEVSGSSDREPRAVGREEEATANTLKRFGLKEAC